MAIPKRRAPAWICCLLALFPSSAATQTVSANCSSPGWSFEQLSEKLQVSEDCIESLAARWTESQTAALLESLRRLTDVLQKHLKTECKDAAPAKCPPPAVHSKGGLVCTSVDEKRYCKPMCNEGYDFTFLRKSKLYEECSAATAYKWTTAYVGGNKLAVCNKSNIQVAGAQTAYFPKDQDCLRTKSNSELEKNVTEVFKNELRRDNVNDNFTHTCLLCR